MILDVPFFTNDGDGSQCLQICMRTAVNYYLKKDYSLEELDKMTGRKPGLWTWTPQIVNAMYELGLDVTYYSKEDCEPYLHGEPYFREHFGNDADAIIRNTDLPVVLESIKQLIKYRLFEKKTTSIEDLQKKIENNQLPLVLIDWNKTVEVEGEFQGHMVVVTGFDEENIYYHESGPENPIANKKLSKFIFDEAMNANGTDNDVVIVKGIK